MASEDSSTTLSATTDNPHDAMKRIILMITVLIAAIGAFAQTNDDVVYLERVGNGGTRVFSVTLNMEKEKDLNKLSSAANRKLLKAILFDGVENYNQGQPLVANPDDSFANSIIDESKKAFNTYCKLTELENSEVKTGQHFIIELNHYNLLRLLKMRGSLKSDFKE